MFPITPMCTSMFSMWQCVENITKPQSGFVVENIMKAKLGLIKAI